VWTHVIYILLKIVDVAMCIAIFRQESNVEISCPLTGWEIGLAGKTTVEFIDDIKYIVCFVICTHITQEKRILFQ
jgi:hypothetical protein